MSNRMTASPFKIDTRQAAVLCPAQMQIERIDFVGYVSSA